jgi:hypothetical protein
MHVLIIFILIVGLVLCRIQSSEEGFMPNDVGYYGYLYGHDAGAGISINKVDKLNDGSTVYIAKQGPTVKMVTDKGESKYFDGELDQFNRNSWNSYTSLIDGNKYIYKPPPTLEDLGYLGYLYGPSIMRGYPGIPVTKIEKLNDGSTVYMARDGIRVKMVTNTGEEKYFEGSIDKFNRNSWNSYNRLGPNHMYRPPFENLGYLYGSWIGPYPGIRVTRFEKLNDGSTVYIAQQGPHVKMVTNKGEAKYFEGKLQNFDKNSWNSYNIVDNKNYMYSPPYIIPEITQNTTPQTITTAATTATTSQTAATTATTSQTAATTATTSQTAATTATTSQTPATPATTSQTAANRLQTIINRRISESKNSEPKKSEPVQAPLYSGVW